MCHIFSFREHQKVLLYFFLWSWMIFSRINILGEGSFSECTSKLCNIYVVIRHVGDVPHSFKDKLMYHGVVISFINWNVYWMIVIHLWRSFTLMYAFLRGVIGRNSHWPSIVPSYSGFFKLKFFIGPICQRVMCFQCK